MSEENSSAVQSFDGFIQVCSKKKNRRGQKNLQARSADFSSAYATRELSADSGYVNIKPFLRRYAETECDLRLSTFFTDATEKIFPFLEQAQIEAIVCLGLGRLSECAISRHQLAFIRCLQEKINFKGEIQFYDPIFNRDEVKILQDLEGIVLTENLEGKYLADRKTLFYLPHCPKQISNNLLWKNWQLDLLSNIILISNSFESILTNSPRRFLDANAKFILEIAKYCVEIRFPVNYKYTDIFNDISLHCFDIAALKGVHSDFWKSVEPHYNVDTLELITREIQQNLKVTNDDIHS
ncbi:SRR1-like protein [Topomyia yanbarensis]|uniref:SRR1-like protein n=1 Tax=Topomyia yanbarensis TaxID=2498891 RepID=UPI00273BBA19|nr:SRR1-like protein [Topomyia yanbarensis]